MEIASLAPPTRTAAPVTRLRQFLDPPLRRRQRLGCGRDGIGSPFQCAQLGTSLRSPLEELLVGRAPKAAFRLGDPVELELDLRQAVRFCFERRQKAAEIGRGFPQSQLDVAQLVAGALEVRRETLEWGHFPFGNGNQARGSLPLFR